jgi:hypothetical protein
MLVLMKATGHHTESAALSLKTTAGYQIVVTLGLLCKHLRRLWCLLLWYGMQVMKGIYSPNMSPASAKSEWFKTGSKQRCMHMHVTSHHCGE